MNPRGKRHEAPLFIENPQKYLALAVIYQAIKDWESTRGAEGKGCFWLLNCNEDVDLWCELAGIAPELLRNRALSLGCRAVENFKESIEMVLKIIMVEKALRRRIGRALKEDCKRLGTLEAVAAEWNERLNGSKITSVFLKQCSVRLRIAITVPDNDPDHQCKELVHESSHN